MHSDLRKITQHPKSTNTSLYEDTILQEMEQSGELSSFSSG